MVANSEELPLRQLRPAQVLDQLHLHRVGVLQFVDEQEADAPPQTLADLRVVADQVAGQDEQVLEIDNAGAPLELEIAAASGSRETLPTAGLPGSICFSKPKCTPARTAASAR